MIQSRFSVKQFLLKESKGKAEASAEHHQHRAAGRTAHTRASPRTWMTAGIVALATLAAMATLPATSAQAQIVNICDRSPLVMREILLRINEVENPLAVEESSVACDEVTRAHLSAIDGTLNIRSQRIASLKADDFSGLTGIRSLSLRNNRLTTLPDGVFAGLTSLQWLFLDNNDLTELSEDVFNGRTGLQNLGLSGNELTTLPAGLFNGLTGLRILDLHNNLLAALPAGLFNDSAGLQTLYLRDNDLIALPAGVFNGLADLQTLWLDSNPFTPRTGLPAGIFDDVLDTLRPIGGGFNVDAAVRAAHFVCSHADADAIVAATDGVDDCLRITAAQLAAADPPTAGLTASGAPAEPTDGSSDDAVTGTFTLQFSPEPTTGTATVTYALTGSALFNTDYTLTASGGVMLPNPVTASGTFAMNLAQTPQAVLTITPAHDVHLEASETVILTVSGVDFADATPDLTSVAGSPQTLTIIDNDSANICDRTPEVESEILVRINEGEGPDIACDEVTHTHLAAIVGTLGLQSQSIASLRAGDFAGLTGLQTLNLGVNGLTALPESVFNGLTGLQTLDLYGNVLATLPESVFNGLAGLQTLWLDDNGLTALPEGVFNGLAGLQTLWLGNNALTTLPAGVFNGLAELRVLGLDETALATLPAGVFNGLTRLQTLDLFGNVLTTLPAGVFNGLIGLQTLHLDGNRLTALPAGVFNGLADLQTLGLGSNPFTPRTGLPAGIFDDVLDTLMPIGGGFQVDGTVRAAHFVCSRDDAAAIVAVTDGVDDCLRITTAQLDAATVPIAGLGAFGDPAEPTDDSSSDAVTGTFTLWFSPAPTTGTATATYALSGTAQASDYTLASSALAGVTIDSETEFTIDFALAGSQAVLTLTPAHDVRLEADETVILTVSGVDFTSAALTDITSVAGSPQTLTIIDNDSANICDRTDEVQTAILARIDGVNDCGAVTDTHLAAIGGTLGLRSLGIASLQAGDFVGLTSLQTLRLGGNALTELPEGVFNGLAGHRLQTLDLGGNRLTALHEGVFNGLAGLQTLYLDSNVLTTLPAGVFNGLAELRVLGLDETALTTLPEGVFNGLTSLQDLDLFGNALTTLPDGVFNGLAGLQTLGLGGNGLTALPDGVFNDLAGLQTLGLGGNAFTTGLPANIFDNVLDTLTQVRVDPGLRSAVNISSSATEIDPSGEIDRSGSTDVTVSLTSFAGTPAPNTQPANVEVTVAATGAAADELVSPPTTITIPAGQNSVTESITISGGTPGEEVLLTISAVTLVGTANPIGGSTALRSIALVGTTADTQIVQLGTTLATTLTVRSGPSAVATLSALTVGGLDVSDLSSPAVVLDRDRDTGESAGTFAIVATPTDDGVTNIAWRIDDTGDFADLTRNDSPTLTYTGNATGLNDGEELNIRVTAENDDTQTYDVAFSVVPRPTSVSLALSSSSQDSIIEGSITPVALVARVNRAIPSGDADIVFKYVISGVDAADIVDRNTLGTPNPDGDDNSLTGLSEPISAGETDAIINIYPAGDTLPEGEETFTVTLVGPQPSNAVGRVITYNNSTVEVRIIDVDMDLAQLGNLTTGALKLSTGGRVVATFDPAVTDYGITLTGVSTATLDATPPANAPTARITMSAVGIEGSTIDATSCARVTTSGVNRCIITGIDDDETAVVTIAVQSIGGSENEEYTVAIGPAYARLVTSGSNDVGGAATLVPGDPADADAFTIRVRNYNGTPFDGYTNIRIDSTVTELNILSTPAGNGIPPVFNASASPVVRSFTSDNFEVSIDDDDANPGPGGVTVGTRSSFINDGNRNDNFRVLIPAMLMEADVGNNDYVNSEDVVFSVMARSGAAFGTTDFAFGGGQHVLGRSAGLSTPVVREGDTGGDRRIPNANALPNRSGPTGPALSIIVAEEVITATLDSLSFNSVVSDDLSTGDNLNRVGEGTITITDANVVTGPLVVTLSEEADFIREISGTNENSGTLGGGVVDNASRAASRTVTLTNLAPGLNTVKIIVTPEGGELDRTTDRTYTITINIIDPAHDTRLSSITVGGESVTIDPVTSTGTVPIADSATADVVVATNSALASITAISVTRTSDEAGATAAASAVDSTAAPTFTSGLSNLRAGVYDVDVVLRPQTGDDRTYTITLIVEGFSIAILGSTTLVADGDAGTFVVTLAGFEANDAEANVNLDFSNLNTSPLLDASNFTEDSSRVWSNNSYEVTFPSSVDPDNIGGVSGSRVSSNNCCATGSVNRLRFEGDFPGTPGNYSGNLSIPIEIKALVAEEGSGSISFAVTPDVPFRGARPNSVTYTVRGNDTVDTLESLRITAPASRILTPAFDSNTFTYRLDVPSATTSLTLAPTLTDEDGMYRISAMSAVPAAIQAEVTRAHDDDPITVNGLTEGINVFLITGVARNTTDTQLYTLNVVVNADANVCLRTAEVATEIVRLATSDTDCSTVTTTALGDINGTFNLGNKATLTSLKADDFAGLSDVAEVEFGGSDNLTTVPANAFSGLRRIQTAPRSNVPPGDPAVGDGDVRLFLRRMDKLASIDAGAFANTDLSDLNISSNPLLTSLPSTLLNNSPDLRFMNAQNSGLTAVPATLFSSNPKLEGIRLDSNALTNAGLPAGLLSDATSLKSLRLDGNYNTGTSTGLSALLPGFLDGPLTNGDNLTSVRLDNILKRQVALTGRANVLVDGTLTLTMEVQDLSGTAATFPADLTATLTIVNPANGSVADLTRTVTVEAGDMEQETDIVLTGGVVGDTFTVQLGTLTAVHTTNSALTNTAIIGPDATDVADLTAAAAAVRTIIVGTGGPLMILTRDSAAIRNEGDAPRFLIDLSNTAEISGNVEIPYEFSGTTQDADYSIDITGGSFETVSSTPVIRVLNAALTGGSAQVAITLSTVAPDGIDLEAAETIILGLTKPDNIDTYDQPVEAARTITINDTDTVAVSVQAGASAMEAGTVTIPIDFTSVDGSSSNYQQARAIPVTVTISTGGTAPAAEEVNDFPTASSANVVTTMLDVGTLTGFGQTQTVDVEFPFIDDSIVEGDENLAVAITSTDTAASGTITNGEITITDNDESAVTVSLPAQVTEGTDLVVSASLTTGKPLASAITLAFAVSGVDAADFTAISPNLDGPNTITIPAGSTNGTGNVNIPILEDADTPDTEASENITVTVTDFRYADADRAAAIDILVDEISGSDTAAIVPVPPDNFISLAATTGDTTATELNNGPATFTINLTEVNINDLGDGADADNIDLVYTLGGDATPPTDLAGTTAVVTASGTEDYNFAVDSSSTATGVTIIDRTNTAGVIGGTIRVPVIGNFSVSETAKTVILSVTPVSDRRIEDDETVILAFTNITNTDGFTNTAGATPAAPRTYVDPAPATRTVMITDMSDDLLTLVLPTDALTEPNSGTSSPVAIPVMFSALAGTTLEREVSVTLAPTAGTATATGNPDYAALTPAVLDDRTTFAGSGTVMMAASSSPTVVLFNDAAVEDTEQFTVDVAGDAAVIDITGGVIRIDDSETNVITVTAAPAPVLTEATGDTDQISITVALDSGVTLERALRQLNVDTSAATNASGIIATAGGTDYTAITTEAINLPANTTFPFTHDITVAINDDNIVEGPEVFSIDVTESTSDPAIRPFTSVDGIIVDDDTTRAVLTITSEASGGVIEGQSYAATVTLEDNKTLAERATFTIALVGAGAEVTLASPPTLILSVGDRTVTKAGAFIITSDSLSNENDTFGATITVDFGTSTRDYTNLVTPVGFSGVRINEVPTLRLVAGTDSAAREDGVGLVNGVGSDSSANTATFEIRLRDVDTAYTGDVVFPVTIDSSSTAVAADYEIGVTGVGTGGPSSTTFTIGTDVIFTIGNDVINGGIDGNADVILTVTPVNDNRIETTVETLILSLGTPTTVPSPFDAGTSTTATVNITDLPNQIRITDIGNVLERDGADPDATPNPIVSTAVVPVTFTSLRADTVLDRAVNLLLDSGTPGEGIVAVGGNDGLADRIPPPTGADYEQENDIPVVLANFSGNTQIVMVPINVLNDNIVEGPEGISIAILENPAGTNADDAVMAHSTVTINLEDDDDTTATVVFGGVARTNDGTATATVELVKPLAADATFTLELLSPVPNGVTLSGDLEERQVTITAGQTTTTQNVAIGTDGAAVDATFTVGIVAPPAYTDSGGAVSARQDALAGLVTPTVSAVNTIAPGPTVTLTESTQLTATDAPTGGSAPDDIAQFIITLANFTAAVRGGDGTEDATVGYAFTGGHTNPATFGGDGVGDYTVTGAFSDDGVGGNIPTPPTVGASGTFTVPAAAFNSSGTATLTLTVTPTADNRVENTENVILTISSPSHLADVTGGSGTIRIFDGPPSIVATIASDATVTEPAAAGSNSLLHVPITLTTTVDVTLDRPITLDFYASTGGTGPEADAMDFNAIAMNTPISVTVPTTQALNMGGTNITLNNDVRILGDNVVEGPETFMATLVQTDTAITINDPTGPVTITDEDTTAATVKFSGVARIAGDTATATVELDEDKELAVEATFTLELLGPESDPTNVPTGVTLPGNTSDEVGMRQVTIAAGTRTGTATVAIDATGATAGAVFRVGIVAEGQTNEPTYTGRPDLEDIVTPLVATADNLIVDGPAIVLTTIDSAGRDTVTGVTNADRARYVINLSGYTDSVFSDASATDAEVGYAFTGGSDSDRAATFGTDYTVSGLFSDDGGAFVADPVFNHSGDGTGTFTFPFSSGTNAFDGGFATLTLTVTPTPDGLIENPETVILTLSDPTLGADITANAIPVVINDAEDQITVAVPASLAEGATAIPVTFTAAADTVLNRNVELRLNTRDKGGLDEAVENVDYDELTNIAVVLFENTAFSVATGGDRGTARTEIMNVPLAIATDRIVEGDEEFEIRFSKDNSDTAAVETEPAVMDRIAADVIITDDDRATVEIVADSTASVGTPFTATVRLRGDDGSGNTIENKVLPTGVSATYTLVPADGSPVSVTLPTDITPASATVTIPNTGVGASSEAAFDIMETGVGENFILGIGTAAYTTRTGLGSRITVAGVATSDIRINNNTSTLSALALTTVPPGTIDLGFASDTEAYTPSLLDNSVTAITVTPTVTPDVGATYEIRADISGTLVPLASGAADTTATFLLAEGMTTTITVTVTAEDTMASTAYTIALTRSADANLCNRTPKVRDAIVAAVAGVTECAAVTNTHLDGITSLTVDVLDTNPTVTDFAGLSRLTTLNLTNSRFDTLPVGVFASNTALTTLNLSADDGRIANIAGPSGSTLGVFDPLIRLTSLDLSGNRLATLSDDLFDTLVALVTLDLEDNELASVNGAVFGTAALLPALDVLNLAGNGDLVITAGSLDTVLPKLTSLTWPTPREATFAPGGASAVQGGSTTIQVELDGILPVTVNIPVTVTAGTGDGVAAGTAIIAVGQDSSADAGGTPSAITATLSAVSGTLDLGTPTATDGTNPITVRPDVLAAMITSSSTRAAVTITTGPTASLTVDDRSLVEGDVGQTGETATITIDLTSLETNADVTLAYEITSTDGAVLGTDYTATSSIGGVTTNLTTGGSFNVTGITGGADMGTGMAEIVIRAVPDNYDEVLKSITLEITDPNRIVANRLTISPRTIGIDLPDNDTAMAAITNVVNAVEPNPTVIPPVVREDGGFTYTITKAPDALATVTYNATCGGTGGLGADYDINISGDSNLTATQFCNTSHTEFTISADAIRVGTQGSAAVTIAVVPLRTTTATSETITFTVTEVNFTDAPAVITDAAMATVNVMDSDSAGATLSATLLNDNDLFVPTNTPDVGAGRPDPAAELTIELVRVPRTVTGPVVVTVSLTGVMDTGGIGDDSAEAATAVEPGTSGGRTIIRTPGGHFFFDDSSGISTLAVASGAANAFTVSIPAAQFADDEEETITLDVGTGAAPAAADLGLMVALSGEIDYDPAQGGPSSGFAGSAVFHTRAVGSQCLVQPSVRDPLVAAAVAASDATNCDDYDPDTTTPPTAELVLTVRGEMLRTEDLEALPMNTPNVRIVAPDIQVLPEIPELPLLTTLTIDAPRVNEITGMLPALPLLRTLSITGTELDHEDLTPAVFSAVAGALTTLDLEDNNIGTFTGTNDRDLFDSLDNLTTLRLAGNDNLNLTNGALDEVLDTLTSLTWPVTRVATGTVGYTEPASTTPAPTGASGQLAALNIGPLVEGSHGAVSVTLDRGLPVGVEIEITSVCLDGVIVGSNTTITDGRRKSVVGYLVIPFGGMDPTLTRMSTTAAYAAGHELPIEPTRADGGGMVPPTERIRCDFEATIERLVAVEAGTTTVTAVPRTSVSLEDQEAVNRALLRELQPDSTRTTPLAQIIAETEAITTALGREQVGMVTRLVRQRVQDLALTRPAANTTASADTASNDDMQVSLADSPADMQDFVSGLALNTARDMDGGGSYSMWARGQWTSISGSPDIGIEGFNYDGSIVGAGVGVEFRDYDSLFGLALNATRAEVDVTSATRGKTTHEEDMIFAAPYAAWKSKFSGLTLWGTVGVGTGTAEITEADGDTADPGVTVFFTRGGMDVASEISARTDLVFGLSGLFIDKTVEKFSLGTDSIPEINVQAGQAQVDLTAFLNFPVGDTIFRPYFGLASVHEVGDIIADDRHAMEARTGFGWDSHPLYLDVDGFYEFLREDEKAWGIFGEIRYAAANSGFQFGMTGNHGTASSMSEAATSTNTVASEFDASLGNADSDEAEWALGAESSYSFAAPLFDSSGTAAPFISGTHAESGQTLGTGVRFGLTENIDMTVESDRHMPDNDDPYSEHAVGLNARWQF